MSAPGVSLRPLTAGDEPFLRLVYAESRRQELAQVQWPEGALDAFLAMQYDAQAKHYFKSYPGAQFLIVEVDGRPGGRLYYQDAPGEIRILDIALLPEARGRGIGGSLLGEILDEARAANKRVVIHVEKNNRAQSLYLRLGFKLAEDKGVYWMLEWRAVS